MTADLDEFKAEAKKLGFKRITRDGTTNSGPIASWKGFSSRTDTPHAYVQVCYYIDGNRMRVTRAGEDQEHWYTLS